MRIIENTGIYNENTKLNETQDKNVQLMKLYKKWFEHMNKNGLAEIGKKNQFNGMHLMTCFDSYISSSTRIMCYGKEAHTDEGRIEVFDKTYQQDTYYKYDYAIVHPEETKKKDSYNRFYLKTRKLISNIQNGDIPTYEKFLSVINNNLNKTSFMGRYTPCFNNRICRGKNKKISDIINQVDKTVYSGFEFTGLTANIYIHELNILRPTHLIFLCGKGYNNHIKRDFGNDFYDEIKKEINAINVKEKPVSKPIAFNEEQIRNLFGIDNYGNSISIIFAIHPSAHMTKIIRNDIYEKSLNMFIKNHSDT
ncbi:MAG: hypothetical protein ACI4XI_05950 [Ruminococcus sp.]